MANYTKINVGNENRAELHDKLALTGADRSGKTAWLALACELVSIFGGAVTASRSKMLQTHAGYFMAADRRIYL